MARTVIDIDDEALAAAAAELGTTTKVDTVNAALREIVARKLRLEFLEDAASGSFRALAEPGAREQGWR
jgi:Arc/MetJ family transcription regulator